MGHILLLVLIVVLDQATKWAVVSHLHPDRSIWVIPDVFRITYVENRGAAFGFMQDFQWLFIAVTLFILVLAFVYRDRIRQESRLLRFAVTIGLAGAIGNFIDRLRAGYVIDFLHFFQFPVFNLADVAIVVGVGLLVLATIFDSKSGKHRDADTPMQSEIEPEGAGGHER